jgi:fructosamine-3-kinase
MWSQIAAQITHKTGDPFEVQSHRSVGGGCINQTYVISDARRSYFVKVNQASQADMFVAEALGLRQMWDSATIRVPQPICWGVAGNSSYLVLEWLDLGRSTSGAWQTMGRHLATLHQVTSPHGFGWDQPNTIGSTPQINSWTKDWADFFQQHRLGYQFQLARRRGGSFPRQDQLLAAIPRLLNHQPSSSLVHGDLWSGNAAVTQTGDPVIFDPATYFGDREVDIAMTELFGGFPAEFYQGYNAVYPLASDYQHRKLLYNLYHILNHFNLFGGGYAAQANRMIEQILRDA